MSAIVSVTKEKVTKRFEEHGLWLSLTTMLQVKEALFSRNQLLT